MPPSDTPSMTALTAERADADERTWALSVFLARIDHAEFQRLAATLDDHDAARLRAVIDSYQADLALRDMETR
jgi:hypothetical protein